MANAAFVECEQKRGFQVLYMTEPIDQCSAQQLKEFDGKSLVLMTKEDLELQRVRKRREETGESKAKFENLCKPVKRNVDKKVER